MNGRTNDNTSDLIPRALRNAGDNYELKRDNEGRPVGWIPKSAYIAAKRRRVRKELLKCLIIIAIFLPLGYVIGTVINMME